MVNIFSYIKSVQSFKSLYGLTKVTSLSIAVIGLLFVGRAWATPEISAEYSECVLEKMQGQVASVLPFAHRLCESSFPYRKTLFKHNNYTTNKFFNDMSWNRAVAGNGNVIGVVFKKNRSLYSLESIKLGFGEKNSEGDCAPIDKVKIIEFKIGSDGFAWAYEAGLAKDRFECVEIYEVWGKRRSGE